MTVSDNYPARRLVLQRSPHLAEDLDEVGDVKIDGRFEAEAAEPGRAFAAEGMSYWPIPSYGSRTALLFFAWIAIIASTLIALMIPFMLTFRIIAAPDDGSDLVIS